MPNKLKIIIFSVMLGFLNAVIFLIFEWIVNDGTQFIWNDLFNSSEKRFMLFPLAILGSILLSFIIRDFKQKRIGIPETNFLDTDSVKDIKLNDLFAIFSIGAISLLAGASLGPEASLVGIAAGMGILLAKKGGDNKYLNLLSLSSVGALLIAFFGSLIPILIPILAIYKKNKKVDPLSIIVILTTGVTAFITLNLIQGNSMGFGNIPSPTNFSIIDLFAALILGVIGAIISIILKELILKANALTQTINVKMPWIISATIFGGVIALLYLLGGPTIEFSGREGTHLLLQSQTSLTVVTILIIIIAKLLVTAWSLSSGYRGGLVFPSVFMGVAISLLFTAIHPALGGSGVAIGTISGIMSAIISPPVAFVLVLSMIPIQLIGVAISGLIGASIGAQIVKRVKIFKQSKSS